MALLPLTIFAGLLMKMHEQDIQWKIIQFEKYGQFAPKYVAYSHMEMLLECERHNLVYDYEESQCKYYMEDSL